MPGSMLSGPTDNQFRNTARALDADLQGVRRVPLARIQYHLYYRATSLAVEVLAFWHEKRGTEPTL
jgi:plasmid stabilization system protein ParE